MYWVGERSASADCTGVQKTRQTAHLKLCLLRETGIGNLESGRLIEREREWVKDEKVNLYSFHINSSLFHHLRQECLSLSSYKFLWWEDLPVRCCVASDRVELKDGKWERSCQADFSSVRLPTDFRTVTWTLLQSVCASNKAFDA